MMEGFTNNNEDPQTPKSDVFNHAKRLQLRKTRFPGSPITPRNITPSDPLISLALDSSASDGPSATTSSARSISQQAETNVLQEISNSSMRRRRRDWGAMDFPEDAEVDQYLDVSERRGSTSTKMTRKGDESRQTDILKEPQSRCPSWPHSSSSGISKISVKHHSRARSSKASTARRSVSGETPKYIEHLESQLAALQTQLQSLVSPSHTKASSTKLRALTSENRLLRQELTEWEHSFNERIKDQLTQQEILNGSLKTQVTAFENERQQERERLRLVEQQLEDKTKNLQAIEGTNQDLERRLDFMSELVATSPGKIQLHSEAMIERRRKPARPLSISQIAFADLSRSPERHAHRHISQMIDETGLDKDSGYGTESTFEGSEVTIAESVEPSPSVRISWQQFPNLDHDPHTRPSRRMRRFHTGTTGPRSLILPTTTHSGSLPASAPPLMTPSSSVDSLPMELPFRHNLRDSAEFSRRGSRLSSPVWDDKEDDNSGSFSLQRRQEALRALEASPAPSRALSQPENVPIVEDDATSEDLDASSDESPSFNLFEELSRLKQGRDKIEDEPETRPATAVKDDDSSQTIIPFPNEVSNELIRLNPNPRRKSKALVRSPAQRRRLNRSTWSRITRPVSLMGHVYAVVTNTFETHSLPAQHLFTNTWSCMTLSRPVIEFRWWLVRVLVGGLRKKRLLLRHTITDRNLPLVSKGLGISPLPGLLNGGFSCDVAQTSVLGVRGVVEDDLYERLLSSQMCTPAPMQEQISTFPAAPPVTWLKFSMTMIVAVGIAIKDGPASLFVESFEDGGSQGHEEAAVPATVA